MTKEQFRKLTENILLLDGATGSNLMASGMPRGICTETWVIEHKEIFQELQQKGISRDVASEAWEEASDLEEPDETSLLRTAIEKKYSPGDTLDDKAMRRLYGYLQRRGFRMGDITAVLDEMGISREW